MTETKQAATKHDITDFDKIFRAQDLIKSKEVAIAATGITDGEFLDGVRFTPNGAITRSFVARGESRTYRTLETRHFSLTISQFFKTNHSKNF